MSADHTYNGWTNYETWNLKLWLDNDQGSQEYWEEQAQDAYDSASADSNFTRKENAAFDLRERLKDQIEEQASELLPDAGFFTDILNAAVSEVDFQSIAESYLDEIEDEEYVDGDFNGGENPPMREL